MIAGTKTLVLGGLSLFLIFAGVSRADENPPPPVDNDHSPTHLALLDFKRGNLDAARKEIDAAEKAQPDDIPIKILKSRILAEQHDFATGEKLLRAALTPEGPFEIQVALGDLLLRKRDFDAAADIYGQALKAKPGNPNILLDLIYTRVSVSDFVSAGKYFSQLKPLDQDNPAYYFGKAAIAQATGKTADAEEAIETVRTLYGNTMADHYLKTYLEVFAPGEMKSPAARAEPPPSATNASPPAP